MVDQVVEMMETPVIKIAPERNLETAVLNLRIDLKKDLDRRGVLSLNELLDRVFIWENVYGEKLTDDEFEVFSILSLVLGTTKAVYEKKVGREHTPKNALINSVVTQQEIVKTVLANLEVDGKPNRALMRSFGLVTEIFEEYFDPERGRIKEDGIYTESGYWQGVQGMVTTALLFNDIGWEVKLPHPELDVNYEIDLLVKNPEGNVFAVDVTAKRPQIIDDRGTMSSPFFVEKRG
ncbi:MAG: hypothetical protein WBD86_03550, partial [Microgenomates group bacterium]